MKRRAMVMVAALALAVGACEGDDDGDVTDAVAAISDGASTTSTGASALSDGAAATSDDSGDVTATAVTVDSGEGTDDETNDGGTVVDVGLVRTELVRQLILSGMTGEQATCMADNLDMEEVAANGANDLMMFIELFETCGIDASKLTQPGP